MTLTMEQTDFWLERSDWGQMIMGQNDRKPFSWFTDEAGV